MVSLKRNLQCTGAHTIMTHNTCLMIQGATATMTKSRKMIRIPNVFNPLGALKYATLPMTPNVFNPPRALNYGFRWKQNVLTAMEALKQAMKGGGPPGRSTMILCPVRACTILLI